MIELLARAVRTGNTQGDPVDMEGQEGPEGAQELNVFTTLHAAAPVNETVTVVVEDGPASAGPWAELGRTAALSAAATTPLRFDSFGRFVRCRAEHAGGLTGVDCSVTGDTD